VLPNDFLDWFLYLCEKNDIYVWRKALGFWWGSYWMYRLLLVI
jgi:hypothetical protein